MCTRCRDNMDIHITRAMRGAYCWTDHQILRSKVDFSHMETFEQEMDSALAQWEEKES